MEKNPILPTAERWIDIFYKTIYTSLMKKDKSFSKWSVAEQNGKMNLVNIAYSLAKAFHRWQTRLDGKRYFEHIKSVLLILINEFPTITFNQVVAALLHDIVEDTEIKLRTIENIFWKEVANIVNQVTKKEDQYYLWPDEQKKYLIELKWEERKEFLNKMKPIIKARRTEHYFWHMRELTDETLQVKFADRIHNLRDLGHCKVSKIKDQIVETQTYLLPIAKEKNPTAYTLMKKELEKLHKQVYGNTDKFKQYLKEALM